VQAALASLVRWTWGLVMVLIKPVSKPEEQIKFADNLPIANVFTFSSSPRLKRAPVRQPDESPIHHAGQKAIESLRRYGLGMQKVTQTSIDRAGQGLRDVPMTSAEEVVYYNRRSAEIGPRYVHLRTTQAQADTQNTTIGAFYTVTQSPAVVPNPNGQTFMQKWCGSDYLDRMLFMRDREVELAFPLRPKAMSARTQRTPRKRQEFTPRRGTPDLLNDCKMLDIL